MRAPRFYRGRMRIAYTSFLAGVLLVCASTIAQAGVGEPFRLSNVACNDATCSVGEGDQPGLSTVEVSGNLPAYAGYSVRLIIGRKFRGHTSVLDERSLGIFSDGHFTTSIPAYNYADGRYVFVIMPKQKDSILVVGTFIKQSIGRHRSASSTSASSADLIGEWRGINGTAGLVRILADGTYTFNGAPGRYERSGNSIVFSGPLSAWNGGRGTIGDGTIEFYWTTSEGAKQYFVFAKT